MQLINSVYIRSSLVCFSLLLPTFILVQIQKQKLALISQLTRLHLCNGFSIGEHKYVLEQLSNILGAYSRFFFRLQTTGYHHILFKCRLLFYNMHAPISWCCNGSFVNISCQLVCLFVVVFSLQVFAPQQVSILLFAGSNMLLFKNQ